jgi:hypothetical protein
MAETPVQNRVNDEDAPGAERRLVRRVMLFGGIAWLLFALWFALRTEWWSLLGLTCSAAVVMINFLWLEEIVVRLLQPAPHVKAWRLGLRTLARFALFGVALLVTILIARFNAISVLLGFSIVVIGILGEAFYALIRSFRNEDGSHLNGT